MSDFPELIQAAGARFAFVKERRQGAGAPKTALYVREDRAAFLRLGDPVLVERERAFHEKLVALGFPVARLLGTGRFEAWTYWIEASLGTEHFGEMFRREMEASGRIADATFDAFLEVVEQVGDAQVAHAFPATDARLEGLLVAAGVEEMARELPEQEALIWRAWAKIRAALRNRPFCLTHGDFTSHNILPDGVIDFGDHFDGPFGYDLVSAITAPFWFPARDAEYTQWSRFTRAQTEQFFTRLDAAATDIQSAFDALFVLKAHWWAVRNHSAPILQEWRYRAFTDLLERYDRGESLLGHWKRTLGD